MSRDVTGDEDIGSTEMIRHGSFRLVSVSSGTAMVVNPRRVRTGRCERMDEWRADLDMEPSLSEESQR